jgi:hypothetical protein
VRFKAGAWFSDYQGWSDPDEGIIVELLDLPKGAFLAAKHGEHRSHPYISTEQVRWSQSGDEVVFAFLSPPFHHLGLFVKPVLKLVVFGDPAGTALWAGLLAMTVAPLRRRYRRYARPTASDPGDRHLGREVFVSYSRIDRATIAHWVKELERAGVSAWIDEIDIQGAHHWPQAIVEAIRECKVLILMVTRASVASEQVMREVTIAFEAKKHILPLMIERVQIPSSLQYPLAGIQHIDLTEGNVTEKLPTVLRSLAQLGVAVEPREM